MGNPQRAYAGGVRSKVAVPGTEEPAAREVAELDTDRDIALVLAFLNTRDAEADIDVLDDPERWRTWCAERGLAEPAKTEPVREIRDAMRSSITHNHKAPDAPPVIPAEWPLRVTLRDGVPVLSGIDAVGAVLAAAVHLVATDHWDRVKICPAEDCLWAFYDRSRNRSRTWCSMSVCGNREKARSWRERHTAG